MTEKRLKVQFWWSACVEIVPVASRRTRTKRNVDSSKQREKTWLEAWCGSLIDWDTLAEIAKGDCNLILEVKLRPCDDVAETGVGSSLSSTPSNDNSSMEACRASPSNNGRMVSLHPTNSESRNDPINKALMSVMLTSDAWLWINRNLCQTSLLFPLLEMMKV